MKDESLFVTFYLYAKVARCARFTLTVVVQPVVLPYSVPEWACARCAAERSFIHDGELGFDLSF